jgi:hypothetical protein
LFQLFCLSFPAIPVSDVSARARLNDAPVAAKSL